MLFARRKQYFARIFNNKFIQGGYTLYERDHFTCHDPPEYSSAPSAGVAGTGRYGQPSGDSALPRLRWMWKLSLWRTTRLSLSPSWITASTAECGGWCMSAATTPTEMYRPGRWEGMCLCPVCFLLPWIFANLSLNKRGCTFRSFRSCVRNTQ